MCCCCLVLSSEEERPGCLLLWPLFARAPRHWFLENFLLSAPGVQSVFFYSFPCLSPGAQQKKHTLGGVFFFFCSAPVPARGFSFPCLSPGGSKKNTLGGVFFLLRARTGAHSLTAGLGGDVFLSPGWCFFLLRPRPDRGGVFFFCCGPARTLTHSLTHCGLGRFRQDPGGVFLFCCGPAGSFRQ